MLGIVPAAGAGSRIQPLAFSKELLPVGSRVLALPLPLASRDDVRLARKGDELVVSVASYRRLLTLPSGLARLRVAGARVQDGELQVRFIEEETT